MNECFKVGLYDLLSKDKRINRFKNFRDIEVKTVMLFLMQIGFLKNKMTKSFKQMLYLSETICIKTVYIEYMKTKKINNAEGLDINLKTLGKDIRKYERLKKMLLKYIEKVDSTENGEIVASFKLVIIYGESIQKLYEDIAKDEQKIFGIINEMKR